MSRAEPGKELQAVLDDMTTWIEEDGDRIRELEERVAKLEAKLK